MFGLTDIDDVIFVMNYQSNSGWKVKNPCVTDRQTKTGSGLDSRLCLQTGHFVVAWRGGDGGGGGGGGGGSGGGGGGGVGGVGGSKLVLKWLPGWWELITLITH